MTVVDAVFEVETADTVRFAASGYHDWKTPLIVADADPTVEWTVPIGESWRTRELSLRTKQGTEIPVSAAPDGVTCIVGGGQVRPVERFEIVDEDPADNGDRWCGICGYGPSSEIGVKRHHGIIHEGDPKLLSEAPDADALGDGEDVDAEDHGAGDQVDSDEDDEQEDDEPDIALPDGVTVDDVEQLADEFESLGDVAQEIGVTRGRARTITVALGCYSGIKDLPQRRGGHS